MEKTIISMMLVLVMAGTFVGCSEKSKIEDVSNEDIQVVEEQVIEDDGVTVAVYRDGEYDVSASYNTPAGVENVDFKFVLEDDVVKDLEVTPLAVHEISVKMQDLFMAGIEQEVVGKKLSELGEFGAVNGSSLTPVGFNKALEELKAEALAASVDVEA